MKREQAKIFRREIVGAMTDGLDATVETTTFKFAPLYSGGPLYIDGYELPVYVDLATLRLDPSPKALLDHDFGAVVGRLEQIEIKTDAATGRTALFCDAVVGGCETARRVVEWARNVADWSASIGVYRLDENDVERLESGARTFVNGAEVSGPAYVVRNGSLCEGSFVAIGGDGDAKTILAKLKKNEGEKRMTFEKWLEEAGVDAATLTEEELAKRREQYDAENQGVEASGDDDKKPDDVTAELEAIAEEAVATAVDDLPEDKSAVVEGETAEIAEELADDLREEYVAASAVERSAFQLRALRAAKKKIRARIANKPKEPPKPGGGVSASARLAENRRVEAIKTLCASFGTDGARVAATAISGGWSAARTERYINAGIAKKQMINNMKTPGFGAANGNADPKTRDILAASLAITCGMKPERAQRAFGFDQRVIDAATSKRYRNATLRTVVAACNNSVKPGSFGINTDMVSAWSECKENCRALRVAGKIVGSPGFGLNPNGVQAGFSTFSAIDVFTLVLQAFLEPSDEGAPTAWEKIAKTNVLPNFNEISSYSATLTGRLQEIAATGKIEKVSFETRSFAQSAKPMGTSFTIPYTTIVNDQLDAFADLLQQLNDLPNRCIEHDLAELVWRAIDGDVVAYDGAAFVSESRGNYLAGADSALGDAGIAKAKNVFDSQTNGNGIPLAANGAFLLCGSALGDLANRIYSSEFIMQDGGNGTKNIHRGEFNPVVWPYFNAALARPKKDDGVTGSIVSANASTIWALLRDPNRRPAFCVNRVVGFESPILEQFDLPDEWGISHRIIYPYGVSVKHPDGIVVCNGAA